MKPMCFDVLFKGSKVNEFQHLISHISLAVNESSPDCHRHSHSPIFVFDPFDRNSSIDSWKLDNEGNRLHAASTSSIISNYPQSTANGISTIIAVQGLVLWLCYTFYLQQV